MKIRTCNTIISLITDTFSFVFVRSFVIFFCLELFVIQTEVMFELHMLYFDEGKTQGHKTPRSKIIRKEMKQKENLCRKFVTS